MMESRNNRTAGTVLLVRAKESQEMRKRRLCHLFWTRPCDHAVLRVANFVSTEVQTVSENTLVSDLTSDPVLVHHGLSASRSESLKKCKIVSDSRSVQITEGLSSLLIGEGLEQSAHFPAIGHRQDISY